MGSGSHLPDHLADGPTIEEADFIFDGFSPEETSAIHAAVTNLTTEFEIRSTPGATRYFLLGNYDERPKERLRLAQDLLVAHHDNAVAILLEDLDPENDNWENFYLKFRYTLTFIDYPVLVAEDNDGGHELELGEVPLAETYVVKRDYESLSIDHDLEYEKYDAMIAKLFGVFERNDHLFPWTDLDSFEQAVQAVVEETTDK